MSSSFNGRERTTGLYRFTLLDRRGLPVPLANLDTMVLTLTDPAGLIINGRDAQNVLNANGGTFTATTGVFELVISADDMPITTPGRYELHQGLITVTWTDTDGPGELHHPFNINVENLKLVP